MTSVNYVKDGDATFIPSSQRPDGTWRKPIRVKDGYVPQEEQPLYVSKGKQDKGSSPYPVGLSPGDVSSFSSKNQRESSARDGSLYFDVGFYTTTPAKSTTIPGLNFVETPETDKTSSKSKKKSKNKNKSSEPSDNSSNITTHSNNTTTTTGSNNSNASTKTANVSQGAAGADPVKRLRNLRKKLKDIEALEKKIETGELQNPEKEQLEKIQRKDEVQDDIDELENLIEHLNLS